EARILSHPAVNQSIPAAADQEDFVSMGLTTMQKAQQILDNCFGVLAIEMMAAAQALDLRGDEPAAGTDAARAVIRKHVSHLDEDRPLYRDHNRLVPLLRSPDITSAVEAAVGELA
ncbi:MAG: aromatic amino acid lyase, partial [Candidatus Thermoplasmatota archaeon]|nr:aromatic amino acid lyase [Candidatus Thermoplasmatota archaeon]